MGAIIALASTVAAFLVLWSITMENVAATTAANSDQIIKTRARITVTITGTLHSIHQKIVRDSLITRHPSLTHKRNRTTTPWWRCKAK